MIIRIVIKPRHESPEQEAMREAGGFGYTGFD